ncbi:MerR family transcriptional regulator [Salsuginibacillus kocurii]|uniref:MerR family transcriptional regulator n=1 Tax=Salsuginibacillus kocurii TaxID=427078 RepID=UPI00037A7EAD|nr:MerR family transcriptional regulator [Salsuginibacillus kocurii]
MPNSLQTIGTLARRSGETIRTLRYYDDIELLKPTVYKDGGHRMYNEQAVHRLQEIQSLKFLGFSLRDISYILKQQEASQSQLHDVITSKKQELIEQVQELQQTIQQLDYMSSIIAHEEVIDIRVFCFIIHSLVWEHNHYQYNQEQKNTVPTTERRILDQQYYHLFTTLKRLASNGLSPADPQIQEVVENILTLHNQLLTTLDQETWEAMSKQESTTNILSPLTTEEWTFFQNAFANHHLNSGEKTKSRSSTVD